LEKVRANYMSVNIERGQQFLGVPLLKVRNVLKAWRFGGSEAPHNIAVRKDVGLDPRTVMVILEELRDRGLIGPEERDHGESFDGLTDAGKALASARGQSRVAKSRAWSVLGDVDVVVVTGRPERFMDTSIERFEELARQLGGENILNSSGTFRSLKALNFVVNHFLHGGRKHPLLSVHSMPELQSLACPCRLLFDASKGGGVDRPILARHPDSKAGSDQIEEGRRMPDLFGARQPLRPISADLADPASFSWRAVSKMGDPWPSDDFRYRLAMDRVHQMHLIRDGSKLPSRVRSNVVMRRLDASCCDGRGKIGMIVTDLVYPDPNKTWDRIEYPALGVMLARDIIQDDRGVWNRVKIVDGAHRGRSVDYAHFVSASWWLSVIVSADIERIMRRDLESGTKRPIQITVEDATESLVARKLARELAENAPKILETTSARLDADSAHVVSYTHTITHTPRSKRQHQLL
jgi:hypothetical protein